MTNYNKILIKNGTVYNVPNKKTGVYDVLISNSKIEKISKNIKDREALVVDAKDKT